MVAAGVWGAIGVVGGAVVGAAGNSLRARYRYKGKLDSLKQERSAERARSFDKAKTGYRELYRKFACHYRAAVKTNDFEKVLVDFEEAWGVGFKPLNAALERFWPVEQRLHGRQPEIDRWWGVEQAFKELVALPPLWEDRRGRLARLRRFDELAQLAQLRDQGALTEHEFQAQKASLLS